MNSKMPRWIKADPLHCLHCAGVLDLSSTRDGKDENAEKYDAVASPDWPFLIALECAGCGAVYPLLRVKSLRQVSAIQTKTEC